MSQPRVTETMAHSHTERKRRLKRGFCPTLDWIVEIYSRQEGTHRIDACYKTATDIKGLPKICWTTDCVGHIQDV